MVTGAQTKLVVHRPWLSSNQKIVSNQPIVNKSQVIEVLEPSVKACVDEVSILWEERKW